MRVAVDATSLLGRRTGVGTVTAELVRRLAAHDDLELHAFGVTWRGRSLLRAAVPPQVHVVDAAMAARPLRAAWRRGDRPAIERWTGPVDVVWGPNVLVPPAGRATPVLTVHDLTALRWPQWCTPDVRHYPYAIRRAVDAGAWIHTVSHSVAAEVRDAFDVDPARVVAVPNGVTPVPPADPEVGHRRVGSDRYVLFVGTVEPRKDVPRLVDAFDLLAEADADLRLVLAGADGWGVDALDDALDRCGHRHRVLRLGWVEAAERAALLRGASVLAFPSRYEGFGLPVLEAMSVDVPVVATAVEAVVEVSDGAAELVEPDGDAAELAAALARVLDDELRRGELVVAGRTRVAAYDWSTAADGVAQLLRTAGGHPPVT
jgi:glycosyltransferase involved in cell wall biosynthesis